MRINLNVEFFLKSFGIFLMLMAVLGNPWMLEQLFSPDRQLDFWWQYLFIAIVDFFLFLLGFLFYTRLYLRKKELAVFLSVVFFLILVSEIIFRVHDDYGSQNYFFVRDDELGWRINDRHYLGGKIKEHQASLQSTSADRLIYAIGDSFLLGLETDPKKNPLFLTAPAFPDYTFINFGVGGYNSGEYAKVLKQKVSLKAPFMVMLHFFVGNDFSVDTSQMIGTLELLGVIDAPIEKYKLYVVKNVARAVKSINRTLYYWQSEGKTYTNTNYLKYVLKTSSISRIHYSVEQQEEVAKTFEHLKTIVDITVSRGIKLVVVIFPSVHQVDQELFSEALQFSPQSFDDFEIAKPQRILTSFFEERGVAVIDLLVPFQEVGKRRQLFIDHDGHFNEAGNALAAEVITAKLKEINFFERPYATE